MQTATSFNELTKQLKTRLVPFFTVFFAVIFFTYLVLYIVDFYPEPKTDTEEKEAPAMAVVSNSAEEKEEVVPLVVIPEVSAEAPVSITFDKLGRSIKVLNPDSSDYSVLDNELLKGVVRHPESALLGDVGNVFILGHSSYLPNVLNKNFQAFNGIQELTWGDIVRVESLDKEYVYRVDRVYKAKASEVIVPTDVTGSKLTLATCNVFGAKEDRYMLEATLIETNLL